MQFSKYKLQESDKIFRLNLINSITGIKPGNLIGTISEDQKENLAIFSSIVHLGSDPALLGFIVRPSNEVRRNTLDNILSTNVFTINHINEDFIEKAHFTSIKFDKEVSEFEKCKLTPEYISGFNAPFVRESTIKIGLRLQESLPIKNGTTMLVGEIEYLSVPDDMVSEKGYIDLAENKTIGISGLNTYYRLEKITSFPYARLENLPDF